MFTDHDASGAHPLWLVTEGGLASWHAAQEAVTQSWLTALRFRAERHQPAGVPAPGAITLRGSPAPRRRRVGRCWASAPLRPPPISPWETWRAPRSASPQV